MAYAPNALGEPTQVSGYASSVSYHPNGAIAGYTLGNGVAHSPTQNARGLPLVWRDAGIVQDQYGYDANGNVTAITDQQEAGVTSRSLGYDGLDRLRTANGIWGAGSFGYDPLDNLRSSTVGARSLTHAIDPATNRLTGLSGSQNLAIGYDANGNLSARGAQGFTFDIGNRMRTAAGKASYAYDGHGRRFLTLPVDGSWRLQAYSQGGKLLMTRHSAQGTTSHVYLGERLIAEEAQVGGRQYAHTDALGSPVARSNAAGQMTSRTRYEPYGATAAGTNPTGIGFTGHVNDPDTGLVYMQQRYYDPLAGRFLSVDPVVTDAKTGGHFNRYQYGENNPYKFKDPDGRQSTEANNGSYQAPLAPLYQMLKATFGGLVSERPGTAPVNGVSTERTVAVHALEVTHSSSVTGSSLFVGVRSSPGFALQSSVVGERTIGDTSGLTVKVSASAGLGSGLTGSASASTGDGTNSGGLQVSGGLVGDAGKATFGIRPPAVTVGWTVKLSNDAKPATQ